LDLVGKTRKEAHKLLLQELDNKEYAEYILQNLERESEEVDKMVWKPNIRTILENEENFYKFPLDGSYNGPVLVLLGNTAFMPTFEEYKEIFPQIKKEDIKVIEKAGHWVHADNEEETSKLISDFLDRIDHK